MPPPGPVADPGGLDILSTMKRFRATCGALALAGALLGSPALAGVGVGSASGPTLREASRPGAFCSFASCRPRAASPSTAAAFGAVVLAIGWQARRREANEA